MTKVAAVIQYQQQQQQMITFQRENTTFVEIPTILPRRRLAFFALLPTKCVLSAMHSSNMRTSAVVVTFAAAAAFRFNMYMNPCERVMNAR